MERVEKMLSTDGHFQLPGRRALQEGNVKTVAIDQDKCKV